MPLPQAPLTYRQTKDIYDTLKGAGATNLSMPDWSRHMAEMTGTGMFDAGLKDNWLKRLNTSIDRGIEWTGLPELTGEFGAGIGSAFGMEEAGRSAGESIPRMAADMATFFIPGLGGATAAARILPAMGMAGMGAYTETGSPAAGVASAALMGVLPGATDMAEQWALKQMGAKKMAGDIVSRAGTSLMDSGVTEGFSRYMPQNLAQGAGAYWTGQAAAMGLMGGSTMAQQAFAGEQISNPFTGEFWLAQGIQNLPFMALHGGRKLAGPSYKKAIESTGEALLAGQDALAWKQLQREVADYGKTKDKSKAEAQPLTPKAQAMWDRLQGKPPTEEDYTAANGWLTELEEARRRVEQEPTDEEARKNLRIVNSNLTAAIELGDIPFTAFVDSPNSVEVKGEITGISKTGQQVTAWVDTPEGRQKVQFSRGLRTGAHEIGQTVFKMPVDPSYVTWNPEKSEAWKAKEAADAAQAEAKRAQDDLKGNIDLHVEAHRPDELVAKAKGLVEEAEFAAQVDEAAKRNALLRKNAKGEVVATADSRAGDELDAAKRIVAQHDTAFMADRASAEELARKSEGLTAEAFRLEREARQQKIQEVSQLVAQFNSLPMTTKEEKMSKLGVARQIEGLLTGAGFPSMFERKAARWGPLAGITAHNLGLVLDSKGALWLKGMLSELKVSDARVREKPRQNKKISLDRATEQGDSLMGEAVAEVIGSQREFDSELNSSEKQHEMTTVLEGARTEDPIIASAHEDIILKELQDNLDGLQELFDTWNGDREIEFGGTEGELMRMQKYVKVRLDAGEEFDAKLFWDSQNVDLVAAGGDLTTFEQRPHVLTLLNGVTEQLNRPGRPLAAKAGRNWVGKATPIELAPGLPSQLDNAVRVDENGKVVALGKAALPKHGLVLEANLESFAGADMAAMKLYYPEAWVGEGDKRFEPQYPTVTTAKEPVVFHGTMARENFHKPKAGWRHEIASWVSTQPRPLFVTTNTAEASSWSGEHVHDPSNPPRPVGQRIFPLKLKTKTIWEFDKTEHTEKLIETIRKDRKLADTFQEYAEEDPLYNVRSEVGFNNWAKLIRLGDWSAIESVAKTIKDLGYHGFKMPLEAMYKEKGFNYGIFDEKHVAPLTDPDYPESAARMQYGKGQKWVDLQKLVDRMREYPMMEVRVANDKGNLGGRSHQEINHLLELSGYKLSYDGDGDLNGLTLNVPADIHQERVITDVDSGFGKLPAVVQNLFKEAQSSERNVSRVRYSSQYSISSRPVNGREIAVVFRPLPGREAAEKALLPYKEIAKSRNFTPAEAARYRELLNQATREPWPSDAHHDVPGLAGTSTVEEKTVGDIRKNNRPDSAIVRALEGKADDVKVLVQTEAQSDWAALQKDEREESQNLKNSEEDRRRFANRVAGRDHPSLPDWERLVTSATLDYARKNGYEFVGVTDAKTGAMTEGHDSNDSPFRDTPAQLVGKEAHISFKGQGVGMEKFRPFIFESGGAIQDHVRVKGNDGQTYILDVKHAGDLEPTQKALLDAQPIKHEIEEMGGHFSHYGSPSPVGDIPATQGSLQREWEKVTGKAVGEGVAVGVHGKATTGRNTDQRNEYRAINTATGEIRLSPTLAQAEQVAARFTAESTRGQKWEAEKNPEYRAEDILVGSPSLTDVDPITGIVGPKTHATVNLYEVPKDVQNPATVAERETLAAKKKWVPTPEGIQTIADREFTGGGRKLAEVISAMEDADPADRAMAELLIRNLPETLSRVESEFDAKGKTEYAPMIRQRKGKITFAPWNIGESNNSWAGTAMEELQHHVGTLALRDPKNKEAFNGFENLRKRVIAGLSKEKGGERDAFNYMEKLYKKNPNRYIEQGEIHKDSKIEDLVYALQNVDEFYANGNRAHALRERLKLMEPTKHWLSEFVDNLKKLFGIGPKETAFDEFLFHTKQIMDSSEAVAKSFNYLEAHFAQRGYDPNRANDATQVAMRLMNKHGVDKGDPQTLFAELAKPSDMDSDQLLEAKRKFKKLMASPDSKEMGNTAMLFNDPNTGKAIENWFMEQLDTPSSVSYFNAMPETVQRYFSLRVQQMQDVLLGIHNLAKNGSRPVTDLLEPKTLERTAKDMLERVQPFVRQQDVVMTAVSQVRALDSFGTENMLEVMGRPLAAKMKRETPDGFIDEKMGFLRKLTLQIGQWAQSNPLVKELLVRMTGSDTLARKFAQSAQHDVLGYDPANPGVYNEKIAEGWREWLEKGQNKDVVDTIQRTNNVVGEDKVALLAADHPAMAAATKGIDAKTLEKAHQFVRQMAIGTQKGQTHILHRMGENGTVQGAKLVLLQEKELNVEAAMTASRNVLDALVALKENPADVMAGRKLEAAQKVLQPKTLEQLMEAQDRMSKVLIAAKLHFKNNPGWVTAQRKGDFLYKGFRGKEEINMGADSDKEVLARARKHGVKIDLTTKKPNEPGDYATMDWSQDFIDKAKAYDEHAYDAARAAGASDKVLETIQKMAPGAAILKDQHVSYDIGAAETKGRTLSKGGDIVPFTDHFFSWLEGSPAYWNKRLIREQVEMTLLAPEYRAAPETSDGLRQWLNGFLFPDPKPMRALQKAVTTFTLGGNVGFLLNNVFQPFLRGIPEMMSHGVGFWAAFRGVTGALKDAAKSFTKVGGMTDLSKGLPDANERWFMERLNNDLITDRSLFDETEMRKGYDSYKLTASLNASKPKTFGQWVASVGGAYSNVALSMVRHGERANTEATSLGAFRALMRTFPEKGREWAEQKARDVHQATNDPGGRFNRAIGLYDNAGPASRSAAMMAGALQSYTFGTIHQMIRNFQKGWKNSSLTPAEKYAGRKAFLTQLGLQFAVAGALGMPFVSGALALINQVDPSLEINKNVRGLMQQFFAEDGKDGHPLTDMMMSGLPSQLGWDMQSRMSSGELIPGVSERDGFQVSNLFGVPASLATQMAGGVKQIMNGQGAGLMAFVPPGLRSQIRLATGTAGQDNKGRQVLNDMTPGEGVGLALGMRPTRLRQFNDAQRMEKQAEEQDAIRKGHWRQKAAAQVLKGEFGTVMGELKTQLAENPKLDIHGEVRQIAKYAEDQAFPRDLRREAKGDNRSELLRMWNLAPSMPTEEQRLQFRMKVEQQFGVRSEGGKALMNARMMDELRKQRPDATRSELRGMLPRAARPQPMWAE